MPTTLAPLEAVLEDALFLGAELDPRYRVLATTVEPTEKRYAWGRVDDRRVQILLHPVSTVLASLRRESEARRELLTFDIADLLSIVEALGGPPLRCPVFDRPQPPQGAWGPVHSLEGRAGVPDGVAHSCTFEAESGDLRFGLFARFDAIDLRGPEGEALPLPREP
jgi:hypothetical protein